MVRREEATRKTLCACDEHQFFKCKTNTGLESAVVQNHRRKFWYAYPELESAYLAH